MSNAESLATLDVLTKLGAPAHYTDANLRSLVMCRIVNLSLEGGNCDGSCYAYALLGSFAGPVFGDFQAGLRLGSLACELVEQRGLKRFQARTYHNYGYFLLFWTKHTREGLDLERRAFETANQIGDLTYAAYYFNHLNTYFLMAGDPLDKAQVEAEGGIAFAQNMRFGFAIDSIVGQLGLIRTLRGLTPKFGCFDDEQFDELQIERRFSANPDLAIPEGWYWIRKLQARFFAGDYAGALEASLMAQRLLWALPSMFESAEYHFYSALSKAAFCESAAASQRQQLVGALAAHHRQLEVWATACSEKFENRAALVGAEIARIDGRALDAMDLYERAIRSAQANGFVHNEALAYELAARFYAMRGFKDFADVYLRNARDRYLRWRADGKVRQLDQQYPSLGKEKRVAGPTGTIGAPVEHLDLATVIRVSQAVSGEIVLEKLLQTLLRTALEHAGAERGLLILSRGTERRIAAEATTSGDTVTVQLSDEAVTAAALPKLILQYVLHTQETVVLDDAAMRSQFSEDPYIHERQARSILCLPLTNQAKLIGILYLENNLAPRVFSPDRTAVLKLLASQAAISLENTRLYRDLSEREAKIRRLVDANIIGIFIWDIEGQILEANDAFLHMVGYDREDLIRGRLHRTELTPPEWGGLHTGSWAELNSTGSLQPFEKEYFRKDGSRVPVLVGATLFKEGGNEGVAFVLDLSERRRAEEAVRELESDLAHMNRVSMMGELAASLSHEILHPIATARNNARAAMRFLDMTPPNMEEVREALACVVRDADRSKDIVGRMRDHIKKAPPQKERFDLNEAINEVIVMVRSLIAKNGIAVSTHLMNGLVAVWGDRVQLQQVVVNLILNAIEAMSSVEGGVRELSIRTEYSQTAGILFAVHDSGPGIDSKNFERIFEPFYTTKTSGTGMGLSICRSIIDGHGGQLWVAPNEPRGAVFQFTLPTQDYS
jgi:PAS domain S-box-containing protein